MHNLPGVSKTARAAVSRITGRFYLEALIHPDQFVDLRERISPKCVEPGVYFVNAVEFDGRICPQCGLLIYPIMNCF